MGEADRGPQGPTRRSLAGPERPPGELPERGPFAPLNARALRRPGSATRLGRPSKSRRAVFFSYWSGTRLMLHAALLCLLIVRQDGPIITTAVGTGQAGRRGEGGPATSAELNGPFDVAFDRQGNLYVSDTD